MPSCYGSSSKAQAKATAYNGGKCLLTPPLDFTKDIPGPDTYPGEEMLDSGVADS
jgi:hypothetical protein